jgi:hypothetical protein
MKKLVTGLILGLCCWAVAATSHATNYALCTGLNKYNTSYVGSDSFLNGCVPDAKNVYTNITLRGEWQKANATIFTNSQGTFAAVSNKLMSLASTAVSGDVVLYYHSSHGYQDSGKNTGICMYDKDMPDSSFAKILANFKSGVKVIIVLDTCHSGGMFKSIRRDGTTRALDTGSPFAFAQRVNEELAAIRADEAARGIRTAPKLAILDCGWITAADYNQYSWDGDVGGAFTDCFIGSVKSGACDKSPYGNGDSYATFMEMFDYAVAQDDTHGDGKPGSEDYTMPQCTNTTILKAVTFGWVGSEEPSGVRFAPIPDQTATVGAPLAYTLVASNVDGSTGTIEFSVASSTAPAGSYSLSGADFTFTPPSDGSFTFNFLGTNKTAKTFGKASMNVAATLAAPAKLSESGITDSSFTASWEAVPGAVSYFLEVFAADEASPSAKASDGSFQLVTSADGLTEGEYVIVAENADVAMDNTCSGASSGYLSCTDVSVENSSVSTDDAAIIWTLAGDASSCTLFNAAAGKFANPATSKSVGWSDTASGAWKLSLADGVVSAENAKDTSWVLQYNSGSPRFACYSSKQKLLRFFRRDGASGAVFSGDAGNVTSYTVEGLIPGDYTWRVRAVGNAKGPWSETQDVTLNADPSAPPSIRAIADIEIDVGETATAEVKVSTPEAAPVTSLEITAGDAAAKLSESVFSFYPEAPGTYDFTITAVNANGSDTESFAVIASLAEPETPETPTQIASDSFTATWEPVPGAATYELVVIEGQSGSSGGGGGESGGNFTLVTYSTGLTAGDYVILGENADKAMEDTCSGTSSGYLAAKDVAVDGSSISTDDSSIIWTLVGDASSCTLFNGDAGMYANPSTVKATVGWSDTASGSWTLSMNDGVVTAANAKDTSWILQYNSNSPRFACYTSSQKKLRFFRRDGAKSIAKVAGDVVFSNNVGNVTSYKVEGLQSSTEYTFAFRAVAENGETTDWSAPVTVKTDDGPSAPVWSAIPAQNAYVGATFQFDLSGYLSGSPTPTVTADVGTVTGLHYVYEPGDTGTVTVTLTATNDSGSKQATFVLTVAEPPVGGNHYAVVVGCNKYDTEYIDSSSFLNGCVPDANHVHSLITSRGEWEAANVTKLTDSAAKHASILSAIAKAAAAAVPGDTFLYFHSSHGGNYNTYFETNTALYTDYPILFYGVDPEGVDNCICSYDADFTAAELASALAAFDPAVNIVVMIDACHSAGMFQYNGTPISQRAVRRNAAGKVLRSADPGLFAEAVNAQIGAIRRARGIRAASNVAFVTAANFDEYSYDSQDGDGGEFTTAFIEGVTNGLCDGAEYGDQDGWATFYEGWNYAKDIAVGMPEGTEVDDEGNKVDANGYALYDNTYYAQYYDEPEYYYDYYFTHPQIDNESLLRVVRVGYAGNPTLAAPVANPAEDVTDSSFTASWSSVADAAAYRLQVATDSSFSTGAASDTLKTDDFTATSTTYTEFSGVSKGSGAVYAGKSAKTSDGAIQLNNSTTTKAGIWTTASGGNVSRVAVEWNSATAAKRSLQIYGSTTALESYADVKGATLVGTIAYGTATELAIDGTYAYVGILANGGALYLDSVTIDWGTAGSESSVVFDENVGTATSHSVTGLEADTDYFYRVQALGGPVDSDFSNVIALTTAGGTPAAPVWSDIPAQTAVAGEDLVVDLKPYVTGSPKPTITADAGTVENGVLTVSFAEAGAYTVNLTAENSEGSAPAALAVTVTAAPVTIPTLTLDNATPNSFDASWTACADVSSYTLQVSKAEFKGVRDGTALLREDFAKFTTAEGGQDRSGKLDDYTTVTGWTGFRVYEDAGRVKIGAKAEPGWIATPALDIPAGAVLTCNVAQYGSDTGKVTINVSTDDGSTWTPLVDEFSPASGGETVTVNFTKAYTGAKVQFICSAKRFYLDDVVITGEGGGGGSEDVMTFTVADTFKTVDGLDPDTLYYARVKGASDWSEVQSITTLSDEPTAPVWLELPAQTATVGLEFGIDLSIYVTGSPRPEITVDGQPTVDGAWVHTFDEAGTNTYALVANNGVGEPAEATLTVVVTEAPPAKYALCVGLIEFDPEFYGDDLGPLVGAVNDATTLRANLVERGGWAEADTTVLANAAATKAAIRGAIAGYAEKAKAGDTFVLQFSTHGGGDDEEGYDLAVYDQDYTDEDLAEDLLAFESGVKIVVLIDACHSAGMIARGAKSAPAPFAIAERVSALVDAGRAARKARGEDVARSISADEIGWVTAADFAELSQDGGYYDTDEWMSGDDVKGDVPGGVFLTSFTWGWWTGKADVSGTGDGDGWFDALEGWNFSGPVCDEVGHHPQFLHEDVLRSVELGWIGDAAPSEAILFDPVPGVTVGIGEEAVLEGILARNADGTTDGITLAIVDPTPEEADYTFANGKLTFTPAEDGLFLFTVRATSGRTSATKLLGVTATLPAPVALEATDKTDTSFTANWEGVAANIRAYQLQVSTDPSFPDADPDILIQEGFDGVTNKAALEAKGWALTGTYGTYTGAGYCGEAAPSIKFSSSGALTSPTFKLSGKSGLRFWTLGNSTNMTSTLKVELLVGDEWTELETFVPSSEGETKEYEDIDSSATQVRFTYTKNTGNVALDDVLVLSVPPTAATVVDDDEIDPADTSYLVKDLTPGTLYYYRVRAIGNTKSAWSEVIEVTTTGEAPVPVPTLILANPETDADTSIAIVWVCPDVTEARVQIATDDEFTNVVFDDTVGNGGTILTGLTPATTYYGRVCLEGGEWSEVQRVTTATSGEPEGPAIGGDDADIALAGFTNKKFSGKVSDELAAAYTGAVLEYATEVVGGNWNWSEDKVIENGAEWPNIDFDYESLGLDYSVFRLRFLED